MVNPKTLVIAVNNSSLLEIRTWPKPGNVHKTYNFSTTTYEDFLITAYSSIPIWKSVYKELFRKKHDPSTLYTTSLLKFVKNMMHVQSGGNVLLGHYLLLLPLFVSSAYYLNNNILDESSFWKYTNKIFQESHATDTIILYQALRAAQPGGMGTRAKYDIFSKNYRSELLQDKITLEKIFNLSKEYDGISKELAENYKFTRKIVIPQLEQFFSEYQDLKSVFLQQISIQVIQNDIQDISEDLNELLIRTYLFILSRQNDTLITRKTTAKQSKLVSNTAAKIHEKYYSLPKTEWKNIVKEFDNELQKSNGKLNPGTTADLLACAIFVFIIKNRLFQ